jgi:hypothetical protein
MRHAATRREGATLGSIALIRAGDLEDAEGFLDALRHHRDADPAAVAFLEACMHALRGDLPAARQRLQACLASDPSYRDEAGANPYLRDLLTDAPPEAYS